MCKAYKRNPMRSERVYSLSRELLSKPVNFANTLSDQWSQSPSIGCCSQGSATNGQTVERTLDDSAVRRIDIRMFLCFVV